MTPEERKDWFSLARAICRCRAFGRNYFDVKGLSYIIPQVGSTTEHADAVFSYCEDFVDQIFNPKAVCITKLCFSEICSCDWIDGRRSNCVENYHLDIFPKLTLSIEQLVQIAEKIGSELNSRRDNNNHIGTWGPI